MPMFYTTAVGIYVYPKVFSPTKEIVSNRRSVVSSGTFNVFFFFVASKLTFVFPSWPGPISCHKPCKR